MFTHLAPTGLASPSKAKIQKGQQTQIEKNVRIAINDFLDTNSTLDQKMCYNMAHPNTNAFVKSIDKFFTHGLIRMDKCYWSFIREFIPSEERVELKTRWNCISRRDLSLAWLKDSLNRGNLQFQMFGFIACGEELKKTHYEKNACMRNVIILKKVCLMLDDIADLHFQIEPPFVFRTEDTPIALPIAQADGTMSPVQSSNSSLIGCIQFTPNLPMNIHRKRESSALRSSIGASSFNEMTRNNYLDGLVTDLPEVNLASLSNNEPIVQSAKEQSYILEEMLRNQRKRFVNTSSAQFFVEEEKANERQIGKEELANDSARSLIPEDPCESDFGRKSTDEDKATVGAGKNSFDNQLVPASSSASLNSSMLNRNAEAENLSRDNDELSALDEGEVLLEGEVFLDSGETIQLQLELCILDGERIQRLFQVFTGHATGQPLIRYLLLTDQFIYLLVGEPVDEEKRSKQHQSQSGIDEVEELAAEAFERNLMRIANGAPSKFKILIALPLFALDHLTVGIDAQVLCFHTKGRKFRVHPQSGHEQRTFLVETGSRVMGKTIAFAVQRTVAKRANSSNSATVDDSHRQQTDLPFSITASDSSQLAIVLKRFLRRELALQKPEIVHLSLVYWQQTNSLKQQELQQKQMGAASSLECYLYVRELCQWNWTRRSANDWQQSYVVLRGTMLYQFSDSSFKFAKRSLNLRNCMEDVCQVDLKNDEKYTFQLTFAQHIDDGLHALQFSCPNSELMNKWVSALSLALSISSEAPLPVACMAIVTDTHLVFAQEGMNCFVDGFMRSLCSFHIHESAEILAVRTDFNSALLIQRDNGLNEWLMFRERSELDRLVNFLRQRWQFPVLDCDGTDGDNLIKPEFNQLFMECAQMDFWRTMPRSSFD